MSGDHPGRDAFRLRYEAVARKLPPMATWPYDEQFDQLSEDDRLVVLIDNIFGGGYIGTDTFAMSASPKWEEVWPLIDRRLREIDTPRVNRTRFLADYGAGLGGVLGARSGFNMFLDREIDSLDREFLRFDDEMWRDIEAYFQARG